MTETTNASTTAYTRTSDSEPVAGRGPAGMTNYYVHDSIGSVIGLFDKSGAFVGGYSYAPYGEARGDSNTAATNANTLRFGAGYWDASVGLYRLGARYYDTATARFTQYDPTGQEANPYAYGVGNPTNFVDPAGTAAFLAPLAGKAIWALAKPAITGFTKHGINQVINRSISAAAMRNAVAHPARMVTRLDNKGTTFYGARAAVTMNQQGRVVTVTPRRTKGPTF